MSIVSHCCCSNLYRATERYEWNPHHIYDDDDDWFVWMLLTHCCQKFSLTACRWWFCCCCFLVLEVLECVSCMCGNVRNLLTSIETTRNTNILSTTTCILTLDGAVASLAFWIQYLNFESVLEWKWFLFRLIKECSYFFEWKEIFEINESAWT